MQRFSGKLEKVRHFTAVIEYHLFIFTGTMDTNDSNYCHLIHSDAHLSEDVKENADVACGTLKVLSDADDGRACELRDSLSSSLEGIPSKQLAAENDNVAIKINATDSKDMFPGKELDVAQTPNSDGSPFLAASNDPSPRAVVPPPLMPNSPFAFNAQKDENSTGGAPPSTGAFIFGSQPEGSAFTFGSHAASAAFTIGASSTGKSVSPASAKSNLGTTKPATSGFGSHCSAKDFTFTASPPGGVQTKLPQMDTHPFKSVSATLLQTLNGKNEPKKRRVVETGKRSALSSFTGSGLPAALPAPATTAPVDLSSSTVAPGEMAVHMSCAAFNTVKTVEPIPIQHAMESMSLVPAVSPLVPASSPENALSTPEVERSVIACVLPISALSAEPVQEVPVPEATAPDPVLDTEPAALPTSETVDPDNAAPLPVSVLAAPPAVPTDNETISTNEEVVEEAENCSNEMIALRKTDIPAYLHNSEFYRSLQDCDDEDETILVPRDCMKMEYTIENNKDLRALLLTLRFWVADRNALDSVLEYVLSQPFESYEKVISVFYDDFPILKHLKSLTMATEPIRRAIASGDLQLVQYFLNRGGAWPNDAVERIVKVGNAEMLQCALQAGCKMWYLVSSTAAQKGFLGCLRLLHENGAEWDQHTTAEAARGGHLACLQYAHKNGCPWFDEMRTVDRDEEDENGEDESSEEESSEESSQCSDASSDDDSEDEDDDKSGGYHRNEGSLSNICLMAAAYARLDCLKYAHSQGVGIPRRALKAAAKHPRGLECLQYVHQQGLRLTSRLYESAVKQNNLPMLKYFHANGCSCGGYGFKAAVHAQNYEILKFLKESFGKWKSDLCVYAADNDDVNMVLFLLRDGCWPSDNIWSLTGDKFDQVLQCFQELALPWSETPRASSYVAMTGNTEHMKRLIEAGCPWHPETTMHCASKNLPAMMQFLHENGCPWHPLTCLYAAQAGAIDCLKYAYTHGAVIHPELCRRLWNDLPPSRAGFSKECFMYLKLNGGDESVPPAPKPIPMPISLPTPLPIPVLAQQSVPIYQRRFLRAKKKTTG